MSDRPTLATFKQKLKDGGYTGIAGARRAVGKFKDWSDEDKDKARKVVDKYFASDDAAPPPPVTKKVKKTAAKSAAAPPKTTGPLARQQARNKKKAMKGKKDIFDTNPLAAINITNQTIDTLKGAAATLAYVKDSDPSIDITVGMQAVQDGVTSAVNYLNQTNSVHQGHPSQDNGQSQAALETQRVNFAKASAAAKAAPAATPSSPSS